MASKLFRELFFLLKSGKVGAEIVLCFGRIIGVWLNVFFCIFRYLFRFRGVEKLCYDKKGIQTLLGNFMCGVCHFWVDIPSNSQIGPEIICKLVCLLLLAQIFCLTFSIYLLNVQFSSVQLFSRKFPVQIFSEKPRKIHTIFYNKSSTKY